MTVRSICLAAGMLWIVGCGGSSDQPTVSTTNSAKLNSADTGESNTSSEQTGSTEPPGTMQLPADAVFPSPQAPAAVSTDPRAGGFELPPIDAATADKPQADASQTVTAQRPILDEPQTPSVALQAGSIDEAMQYAHASGKVCVVDFWSLSCGPCLKEFPGLVALQKKYGDRVTCVSVNCDYDGRKSKPAERYRERAEEFLKANHAEFKNFLCTTPSEEVYAKLKTVTIPVVLVLGADGQPVKVFADSGDTVGFSYEKDVNPLVQSLLDKSPAN